VLAYVFWHRPAGLAPDYESRLGAFHAALAADPPQGFGGSCTLRLDAAPWLEGAGPAYEDWYLVPDWDALGALNVHAVTGSRAAPHDAAAARAGTGAAGVYALMAGAPEPPAQPHAAWLAKPAGVPYGEFHDALRAALPPGASAWQRQMTLGPAGEYTVRAAAPLELPWRALAVTPVRIGPLPGRGLAEEAPPRRAAP
jgi:hypothetical protein